MKPLKLSPLIHGFTLIELAIVMFIVALLLGGMLLPLAAQQDVRNFGDTSKILADSRDALLGFAMARQLVKHLTRSRDASVAIPMQQPCVSPHAP